MKELIDIIDKWSNITGFKIVDTSDIFTNPNFKHIQEQIKSKVRVHDNRRINKRSKLTRMAENTEVICSEIS